MRRLRVRQPCKRHELAPADERHGAVDFPVSAEWTEVGDATPAGMDRPAPQFGCGGLLRIGERRRCATQAGQAEPGAEQVVVALMAGDPDSADESIGHDRFLRSRAVARAGSEDKGGKQAKTGSGDCVHAGTVATAARSVIGPRYESGPRALSLRPGCGVIHDSLLSIRIER
jgi:hypothetical protein